MFLFLILKTILYILKYYPHEFSIFNFKRHTEITIVHYKLTGEPIPTLREYRYLKDRVI